MKDPIYISIVINHADIEDLADNHDKPVAEVAALVEEWAKYINRMTISQLESIIETGQP